MDRLFTVGTYHSIIYGHVVVGLIAHVLIIRFVFRSGSINFNRGILLFVTVYALIPLNIARYGAIHNLNSELR
jgi:hypothetical protein